MPKIHQEIVRFAHGRISFATGKFDDWAVFVEVHNWPKWPTDEWYFGVLKKFQILLGDVVYEDFVSIFEMTTAEVDTEVIKHIRRLAKKYPTPWQAEGIYYILYGGMIAEENKANAILKKRMKMLGVHQLLKEGYSAAKAANFSRGKTWVELNLLCDERGF